MKSGPLSLRNGDFDVQEAARAAARRAGMTLGEWLDDAIAERAARLRITPADLDESDQIEAIAARLGALPLDDAAPRRLPRRIESETPVRGRQPNMRLLEAAAARLGLEPQAALPDDRDDVIDVARRIAELEDALGRRRSRHRQPEIERPFERPLAESRLRRIAESLLADDLQTASPDLRRIEARLDRLVAQMELASGAHALRPDPLQGEVQALRGQIDDLSRAIAVIGQRATSQSLEPALRDLLARIEASRADGVPDEALAPIMHILLDVRTALENAPAATVRALGEELDALHHRLDAIDRTGDSAGMLALRRQVEGLARSLADLVMRLGGQDALHAQIEALAERVEEIAAAPRELSERLVGLVDDLRQCIERLDASPAFRSLESRIEDIAAHRGAAAPGITQTLAELREAIDNLTEHPTMRAMQMQMAQLMQITGEFPRRLADTLDDLRRAIENMAGNPVLGAEVRTAPLPGHVTESLTEIRLSLERLAANAGVRLADDQAQRLINIEERVTEISEKLDSPPVIERIAGLQEALLARIDRLRSELPNEQIAALRTRVEEVHRAVSQPIMSQALPQELQAKGDLEEIVGQLALKLERAASTGAQDPRALQAIENQVLRIAERLDRHGEASEAISTLERSIGELFTQVGETRQASEANLNETIARDLSSLRSVQDETDRRTRATLEAVHETLEKVVDRLAMLEGDVGVLRVAPASSLEQSHERPAAAAPAVARGPVTEETAAPAPVAQAPEPPALVAPAITVDPAPAALAPVPAAAPQAPSRHDMTVELSEPRAAQKSFIAAARRATQLMGGAPPPPPRVEHDGEIAEARTRARAAADALEADAGAGVTSLFGETSRKIMLGVAGLALSMGAYQLMREQTATGEALSQQTTSKAASVSVAPPQDVLTAAGDLDPTPTGAIPRPDQAINILRGLAANGDPAAQFELASRLVEGRGVSRDAGEAVQWLQKSAAQNYAPAQYRLGAVYEKGAGVERSMKEAMNWYRKAAQAGHIRAMHNLGVLLADGVDGPPDYSGAAAQFRRAAEHGLRDSQFNLAVLYVRGLGVDANLVEAYKFFSLAGAQGDADALNRRDEIASRMLPRQVNEARKAVETFAMRTPDANANEAPSLEAIVSRERTGALVNPAPGAARAKTDSRVTSLK